MSPITWRRQADPADHPPAEMSPPVRAPAPVGVCRAEQERYESERRAWRSKRARERESPTTGLRDREF
jgi:hypothetical protein